MSISPNLKPSARREEQSRTLQIVARTGHQVDDIDILPDLLDRGRSGFWLGCVNRLFIGWLVIVSGFFISRLGVAGSLLGNRCRLACTEGRRLGIGRLHQRLFVQRLHHGLALRTGTVYRRTADHLCRFAHRHGGASSTGAATGSS